MQSVRSGRGSGGLWGLREVEVKRGVLSTTLSALDVEHPAGLASDVVRIAGIAILGVHAREVGALRSGTRLRRPLACRDGPHGHVSAHDPLVLPLARGRFASARMRDPRRRAFGTDAGLLRFVSCFCWRLGTPWTAGDVCLTLRPAGDRVSPPGKAVACRNICGNAQCPGRCAPLGKSWHQMGAAIDTNQHGLDTRAIVDALKATGWCEPHLTSDPGHFSFGGCH